MSKLAKRSCVLALVLLAAGCGKKKDKPQVTEQLGGAKVDVARTQLRALVDAYAQWSMRNPGSPCPDSLAALEPDTGKRRDPWGNELSMACGVGRDGFGVSSLGPDGKAGTADDLQSW